MERPTPRSTTLVALALIATLLFQACGPLEHPSGSGVPEQQKITQTLLQFGAKGDGATDDTAALRAAFESVSKGNFCLDGEGRTYVVIGTIRADGHLCLANARLLQSISAADTRGYIRSAQLPAPLLRHDEVKSYPEDPTLSEQQHRDLEERNNLRTILVTGDKKTSRVFLKNIFVNRGKFESLGDQGNAAGVYIHGAISVQIDGLEMTGKGRGYSLFVNGSTNINIRNLYVHDITWAETPGDRVVTLNELGEVWGWNSLPTYVYDSTLRKFVVVRSQEVASGLVISGCQNVTVEDSRIERLLYRLGDRLIPWQADGITVAASQGLTLRRIKIEDTWEGIDISGGDTPAQGVQGFELSELDIRYSFSYGLKIVHAAGNGKVSNSRIHMSGFIGLAVGGPVRNLLVDKVSVSESGVWPHLSRNEFLFPWADTTLGTMGALVGGIRDNETDPQMLPQNIRITNSRFENLNFSTTMKYGILFQPGVVNGTVSNVDVVNASIEGTRGESR